MHLFTQIIGQHYTAFDTFKLSFVLDRTKNWFGRTRKIPFTNTVNVILNLALCRNIDEVTYVFFHELAHVLTDDNTQDHHLRFYIIFIRIYSLFYIV